MFYKKLILPFKATYFAMPAGGFSFYSYYQCEFVVGLGLISGFFYSIGCIHGYFTGVSCCKLLIAPNAYRLISGVDSTVSLQTVL